MMSNTSIHQSMVFVSEGFVFMPNMPMDISPGQQLHLFPFLDVAVNDWFGLSTSSSLNSIIKSYKAKLYTIFPEAVLNKIQDVRNRAQTEAFIRPALELYLLGECMLYQEATQFLFQNTNLKSDNQEIPHGITPLSVDIESGEYNRLFENQAFIIDGRNARTQLPTRRLRTNEDLSNQRFALVKPMGTGTIIRGVPEPQHMEDHHRIIDDFVQKIRRHRNNQVVVKSLDFLRRALVLEKSGFYNEAYLNCFRIIEAFANSHRTHIISNFLQNTFNISQTDADNLIFARHRVVAHGRERLDYFREVGQLELSKIQEYSFALLKTGLS